MKKVFLLFSFLGLFAFVSNAQVCPHANKAKAANHGQCPFAKTSAAKVAALDYNIQEKICSKTGEICYVKREVNCKTGKVSFTNVEYSAETGKFINVSPQSQKTCTKGVGAKATRVSNPSKANHCTAAQKAACAAHPGCQAGGAKATRVSNPSKSFHCTAAQKAACAAHPGCQGAGAKASNNSASNNVKLVSNDK